MAFVFAVAMLGWTKFNSDCIAATVALGDAQIDLGDYGALSGFSINGNASPLYFTDHFVSIDGAAPLQFFALSSGGASATGSVGSVLPGRSLSPGQSRAIRLDHRRLRGLPVM
jgi:hypothetical protein